MVNRATQSPEYWSAFKLSSDDADYISNLLLEAGKPTAVVSLAAALINHRVERENSTLRREMERSAIYQPKKTFGAGDEVLFPALGFLSGQVIERRAGVNPELGTFEIVTLRMRDGAERDFAAGLVGSHRLNDDDALSAMLNQQGEVVAPDTLVALYSQNVAAALETELARRDAFIKIGPDWFLRALMADVGIGHLNLAEAVLDIANGGPLATSVILRDLGLPADVAGSLQVVSLNSALANDDRFDEVSLDHEPAWFLRKLEPAEVRNMPQQLVHVPRSAVDVQAALQMLAQELDDELDFQIADPVAGTLPTDNATVILTFPHRRAGTLGWGRKLAAVLPDMFKPRLPIYFQDKLSGKRFTVWLVKDGRYIFGLGDWYKLNDLPTGAELEIARTGEANVFTIDARRHKPRREWVRHASLRDQRLRLETAQKSITCQTDDLMSVFIDDVKVFDALRAQSVDVVQIVKDVFPEISKLSPQGNVHARTLFAVANVVARVSPLDVFGALTTSGLYAPVGDYYWHLGDKHQAP